MNLTFTVLRRRRWREALGALALLGVLVRALIPVGFMPMQFQGQVQLVLCSPQSVDLTHQHQAPRGTVRHPCLFAASVAAPAPHSCNEALTVTLLTSRGACARDDSPPRAVPWRHAAARGPPLEV
jgi:hypothetical protein